MWKQVWIWFRTSNKVSGLRNESQEIIETGRKGGDSLFRITRVDLSGVLFMLGHYVWRKDLVRKRKAKEGLHKRKKAKEDLGR